MLSLSADAATDRRDKGEKGCTSTRRDFGVGSVFHIPTARPSARTVGFSQPPPSRLIFLH